MSGSVRLRRSTLGDVPALHDVWRRSVDATHDFLTSEDRTAIDPLVGEYLTGADLLIAVNERDEPLAFLGGTGDEIDSLFVDSSVHGRGIGKLLVESFGGTDGRALRVDVNEQNSGGRAFYERLGFRVVGRSSHDGEGRPYPLLHLVR